MDNDEFIRRFGRKPELDDLDRVNCPEAGALGHKGCGVCEHNKLVFECTYCFTKAYAVEK